MTAGTGSRGPAADCARAWTALTAGTPDLVRKRVGIAGRVAPSLGSGERRSTTGLYGAKSGAGKRQVAGARLPRLAPALAAGHRGAPARPPRLRAPRPAHLQPGLPALRLLPARVPGPVPRRARGVPPDPGGVRRPVRRVRRGAGRPAGQPGRTGPRVRRPTSGSRLEPQPRRPAYSPTCTSSSSRGSSAAVGHAAVGPGGHQGGVAGRQVAAAGPQGEAGPTPGHDAVQVGGGAEGGLVPRVHRSPGAPWCPLRGAGWPKCPRCASRCRRIRTRAAPPPAGAPPGS